MFNYVGRWNGPNGRPNTIISSAALCIVAGARQSESTLDEDGRSECARRAIPELLPVTSKAVYDLYGHPTASWTVL